MLSQVKESNVIQNNTSVYFNGNKFKTNHRREKYLKLHI